MVRPWPFRGRCCYSLLSVLFVLLFCLFACVCVMQKQAKQTNKRRKEGKKRRQRRNEHPPTKNPLFTFLSLGRSLRRTTLLKNNAIKQNKTTRKGAKGKYLSSHTFATNRTRRAMGRHACWPLFPVFFFFHSLVSYFCNP